MPPDRVAAGVGSCQSRGVPPVRVGWLFDGSVVELFVSLTLEQAQQSPTREDCDPEYRGFARSSPSF